jgi:hypothetical protein
MHYRTLAALIALAASLPALAEDAAPSAPPRGDYLFPAGGSFSATAASGLPFLAIGEVAHGVSQQCSIGIFAGATPDMPGIDGTLGLGVRPRVILFATGPWL